MACAAVQTLLKALSDATWMSRYAGRSKSLAVPLMRNGRRCSLPASRTAGESGHLLAALDDPHPSVRRHALGAPAYSRTRWPRSVSLPLAVPIKKRASIGGRAHGHACPFRLKLRA